MTALRTDGGAAEVNLGDPARWQAVEVGSGQPGVLGVEDHPDGPGVVAIGAGFSAGDGGARARVTPGGPAGERLPVTASSAALERFGLGVGDEAALQVFGATLDVDITAAVATVPGAAAPEVVVVDMAALTSTLLASGRNVPVFDAVWLDAAAGTDPDALLAAARDVAGPTAELVSRAAIEEELRTSGVARLPTVTFWVVSGTAGLLAAAGTVAAAAALLRRRAGEVAILRSLGLTPAQQGRYRPARRGPDSGRARRR